MADCFRRLARWRPQGRVRRGTVEGRFDDVVGHGFQLVAREHPDRYLDAGQRAFLSQLGCRIAVLADDAGVPDAVVDLDGEQSTYMDEHRMHAYISRPDFVVFGSINDMADLPALVDDLRVKLHGLEDCGDASRPQRAEARIA
jgi:3-(3-hydroxy-phenyl)propionate hydroxylase